MLQRVLSALRGLLGMPDYRAFVEHVRACHPERAVPTEKEYYAQYLEQRYGGGASRCC